MLRKFIDILTIVVMFIVLIILFFEFTPVFRAVVSIFSASAYGF